MTGGGGAPDGILDLVVTNQRSSDVYLLAGLGGGFFDDAHPVRFTIGSEPIESYADNNGDLITVGAKSVTRFVRFNPAHSTTTLTGASPSVSSVAADFNRDGVFDLVVAEAGGFIAHYTIGAAGVVLVTRSAFAGLGLFPDLAVFSAGGQSVVFGVGATFDAVVPVLTFSSVPRLVFPALPFVTEARPVFVSIERFELPLIQMPTLNAPSDVIASESSPRETRSEGLDLGRNDSIRFDADPSVRLAPGTSKPSQRPLRAAGIHRIAADGWGLVRRFRGVGPRPDFSELGASAASATQRARQRRTSRRRPFRRAAGQDRRGRFDDSVSSRR